MWLYEPEHILEVHLACWTNRLLINIHEPSHLAGALGN